MYRIILNFNIIFECTLIREVGIFPELWINLRSGHPLVPGCLDKRGLSVEAMWIATLVLLVVTMLFSLKESLTLHLV